MKNYTSLVLRRFSVNNDIEVLIDEALKYLSMVQLAGFLCVNPNTVRNWVKFGHKPSDENLKRLENTVIQLRKSRS